MLRVAAVVVTYNRKNLLAECMDAILNQTASIKELIIIDNCSTDGTEEMIKTKYKNENKVVYHKTDKNIGGAGGFSTGVKMAFERKNDCIWIMDDDTIPVSTCLEKMIDTFNIVDINKTSFLASSVVGINGETMNVPVISKKKGSNGYEYWNKYLKNKIVEIQSATFVSLLINRKACERVGFPWEKFFIWGDDIEFTLRLTKYFGPAYLVGDSLAVHKRNSGQSLSFLDEDNESRINMFFYYYRNALINSHEYYKKSQIIKQHLIIFRDILKILFMPKYKHRFKKSKILIKAWGCYVLKLYDHRSFQNRMSLEI